MRKILTIALLIITITGCQVSDKFLEGTWVGNRSVAEGDSRNVIITFNDGTINFYSRRTLYNDVVPSHTTLVTEAIQTSFTANYTSIELAENVYELTLTNFDVKEGDSAKIQEMYNVLEIEKQDKHTINLWNYTLTKQ